GGRNSAPHPGTHGECSPSEFPGSREYTGDPTKSRFGAGITQKWGNVKNGLRTVSREGANQSGVMPGWRRAVIGTQREGACVGMAAAATGSVATPSPRHMPALPDGPSWPQAPPGSAPNGIASDLGEPSGRSGVAGLPSPASGRGAALDWTGRSSRFA